MSQDEPLIKVSLASTLKPAQVETPLDLYVLRPLAFLIVRMVLPTKVTPNHLTLLSVLVGLLSAALYASTNRMVLVLAGCLYFCHAVLDCSDGQLARARKTSSRLGRILDGSSDYLVGTMAGIAIAIHFNELLGIRGVALAILGLTSVVVQGTLFDYYKNRYLMLSQSNFREGNDLEESIAERDNLRTENGPYAARMLLSIYIVFLRVQSAFGVSSKPIVPLTPLQAETYGLQMARYARAWAWLGGPAFHVISMSIFAVFGGLLHYVFLRLTLGNLVLAILTIAHRQKEKQLFASSQ